MDSTLGSHDDRDSKGKSIGTKGRFKGLNRSMDCQAMDIYEVGRDTELAEPALQWILYLPDQHYRKKKEKKKKEETYHPKQKLTSSKIYSQQSYQSTQSAHPQHNPL